MSSGRRFGYISPDIDRAPEAADPVQMTGAALRVYCGSCGLGHSGANYPKTTVALQPVGAGYVNGREVVCC